MIFQNCPDKCRVKVWKFAKSVFDCAMAWTLWYTCCIVVFSWINSAVSLTFELSFFASSFCSCTQLMMFSPLALGKRKGCCWFWTKWRTQGSFNNWGRVLTIKVFGQWWSLDLFERIRWFVLDTRSLWTTWTKMSLHLISCYELICLVSACPVLLDLMNLKAMVL